MFFSTSVTSILIGILFYIRNQSPWLAVYSGAGTWSGIWLYSYIIWIILWFISYFALRGRKDARSLRTWVAIFTIAVIIGTLIVAANLEWVSLFE